MRYKWYLADIFWDGERSRDKIYGLQKHVLTSYNSGVTRLAKKTGEKENDFVLFSNKKDIMLSDLAFLVLNKLFLIGQNNKINFSSQQMALCVSMIRFQTVFFQLTYLAIICLKISLEF